MICAKCGDNIPDTGPQVLKHFRDYHPGEVQLSIECPGCKQSFNTLPFFQKHWYGKHHVKRQRSPSPNSVNKKQKCGVVSSVNSGGDNETQSVFRLDQASDARDILENVSFSGAQAASDSEKEQTSDTALVGLPDSSILSTSNTVNSGSSDNSDSDNSESDSESVTSNENVETSDTETDTSTNDKRPKRQRSLIVSECIAKEVGNIEDVQDTSGVNPAAASFLLNLKDKCSVPSSSIKGIVHDTEQLIDSALNVLSSTISEKLSAQNVSLDNAVDVKKTIACTTQSVFQNLRTEKQQDKHFHKSLGVVKPLRYPIGREFRSSKVKGKQRNTSKLQQEEVVFVPIVSVVEKLVNHPDYNRFVEEGQLSNNSHFLDNYMKGEKSKTNKVLKEHPDALRFVLYYDDVEVCSPLKSRAGNQKLGAFYMYLDNIPPKYRSKISNIFVVAVVNTNFIKVDSHGYDAVLEHIVKDLKRFEQGVLLKNNKRVFGTLIAVIGDNLASNGVGGFKEGFTAHRLCRVCMVTLDVLRSLTKEDATLHRTVEAHSEHCSQIQTSKGKNEKLSTLYGVNRDSVLNTLDSYHVVGGLPPDLMHDSLEGYLSLTVRKLLKYFLYQRPGPKLFTLPWLNSRIQNFDYGTIEKASKPSKITSDHINTSDENSCKLHQSASQMWLLATILPMILGPVLGKDDKHFNNFLDALEITRISFSFDIEKWMLLTLQETVERYLLDYMELYQCDLISKQHNLLHYVWWIIQMGSLLNYMCMRCEAKHRYLKRLVEQIGSYKNIPIFVTRKHQLNQAVSWSKSLRSEPACGPIKVIKPKDFNYKELLHSNVSKIIGTSWLHCDGMKFHEECFICVGCDKESMLPVFAKIVQILIYPNVHFVCQNVDTVMYKHHYAAFQIEILDSVSLYGLESMLVHHVLNSHKIEGEYFIALKCCVGGGLF